MQGEIYLMGVGFIIIALVLFLHIGKEHKANKRDVKHKVIAVKSKRGRPKKKRIKS